MKSVENVKEKEFASGPFLTGPQAGSGSVAADGARGHRL